MHFSAILLVGLFFSFRVSAQDSCNQFFPIHSIISAPDGVLNINDEDGTRQIKASVFNTPDCQIQPIKPTGLPFRTNYTTISQAGATRESCVIKTIDGRRTINSFQAILLETNGFPLNNVSFSFQDIDAAGAGWREAAAVFGVRHGVLVVPTLEIASDTYLRTTTHRMPADSVTMLGLSLGDIDIPAAEYAISTIANCPTDDEVKKQKCVASIQFSAPVDKVVFLYTLVKRGSPLSRSSAYISELHLACGCRCRETDPGPHTITAPVPELPGQCVRRESTGLKIECDVLGGQWCTKQEFTEYALTGNTLPNGNLECEERTSHRMYIQGPFTPDPSFEGTS